MSSCADSTAPPPIPRLVFAEDVDKYVREKKSTRDKDTSAKESYQSSDTERKSRRDKFEEALKSPQWDIGSSGESLLQHSPHSPTVTPHYSLPSDSTPRRILSSPTYRSPSLPRYPYPVNTNPVPSLEPIPQVVPKILPEPEPSAEHGPDPTLPANLALHFEQQASNSADLITTTIFVAGILLLPIAFLLLVVSIPLEGKCCTIKDNMVYLLVYQPIWSVVVGAMVCMWTAHQLNILHPRSILPNFKRKLMQCGLVLIFALLVPASYVVAWKGTNQYPITAAGFVLLPPLAILVIAFYFIVADQEGRAFSGFLRNFFVQICVLVLQQIHLIAVIAFIFFFPQVDTFIQVVIIMSYHLVTFIVRWLSNYAMAKFTFKSIDKYKKAASRDRGNSQSSIDLKSFSTASPNFVPPSTSTISNSVAIPASSTLTQTQTFPNPITTSTSLRPLSTDLSTVSLQHFFVNLQGLAFWPVFFLTYTATWKSFVFQLMCVFFISAVYALRLTSFWFHIAAKGNASNQRKLWIIAELTTKLDMLEYRKRVCTEFVFHFLALILSLLAFIVLIEPMCAGYNSKLYFMCHLSHGARTRAIIYAAISIASALLLFVLTLLLINTYAKHSLHTLFTPCRQFMRTNFWLFVVLAASSLVHPYQYALNTNKMVHLP